SKDQERVSVVVGDVEALPVRADRQRAREAELGPGDFGEGIVDAAAEAERAALRVALVPDHPRAGRVDVPSVRAHDEKVVPVGAGLRTGNGRDLAHRAGL